MIYPLVIKHKSSSSCYNKKEEQSKPTIQKEEEKKDIDIDKELSKAYLECLKKVKSNEICKELFNILK